MTIDLRPFSEDELGIAFGVANVAFGGGDDTTVEREGRTMEFDRSIGAFDGGQMVGTAGAYTFELTVPGAAQVAAAGVTWVAVLPTHRRRGVLRSMMEHQLGDVVERGDAVAVLTASEGSIYRRFGYGVAAERQTLKIDSTAALLDPPASSGGTLEMLDDASAAKPIATVYDTWRVGRAGAVNRSAAAWQNFLEDPSGKASEFRVLHRTAGEPDGYLRYKVNVNRERVARHEVVVRELRGLTPEVEAALWQFALDVDLSTTVAAAARPIDDPLPWRLTDPRRVTSSGRGDWLWARILDTGTALSARAYDRDATLTIGVIDRFGSGPAGGCWRLDVRDGRGSCERVGFDAESAEVVLDVADLGSLWMGAVSARVLAAAGRLQVASFDALANAQALFTTATAPWCDTPF